MHEPNQSPGELPIGALKLFSAPHSQPVPNTLTSYIVPAPIASGTWHGIVGAFIGDISGHGALQIAP